MLPTSSKTNQSQSTHKAVSSPQAQGFSAEEQSDAPSRELSNVPDPNAAKSKCALREGSGSPQHTCDKWSVVSSVTPDSSYQDNQDEDVFASSGSTSMSPGPGSNQSALLVSGPEVQLTFAPAVLHNREFSDESPKNDQPSIFEDAEDTLALNVAPAAELMEDNQKPLTDFAQMFSQDDPEVAPAAPEETEISDTSRLSSCDGAKDDPGSSTEPEAPHGLDGYVEPSRGWEFYFEAGKSDDGTEHPSSQQQEGDAKTDEHPAHFHQEDSTNDTGRMSDMGSEGWPHDLESVSDEGSVMNTHSQSTLYREESSVRFIQSEEVSPQSLSDATPETVTSARHFSFEELVLDPSPGPLPVDPECLGPSEVALSNSEEGHSSQVDMVGSPRSTPEHTKAEPRGAGSPAVDYSDPEGYFDCKQAASDLSEPEPDEAGPRVCPSPVGMPEKAKGRVPPSSESEEYEDAPFVHEPPRDRRADREGSPDSSEPSDEEFSLCEASRPPATCPADDNTDNYLTRVRGADVTEQRPDLQAPPPSPKCASERNDR